MMKHFTKNTYLLLASHILAVAPIYTAEYPPLAPWLKQAMQDIWLPEDLDPASLPPALRSTKPRLIEERNIKTASVLMRYNQQKIDWKNMAFWTNPALKNQLIQDILRQQEMIEKVICEEEETTRVGYVRSSFGGNLYYGYNLPANWPEITNPFNCLEEIMHRNINYEELPQDAHHSYLYDITTQKYPPYLRRFPFAISNVKALLTFLWHHHKAHPYALVHYTHPDSGQEITQAPWTFIASTQFEIIVSEDCFLSSKFQDDRYNFSSKKLDVYRAELIKLHLAYPVPITKELLPQSPIVIANNELKKLPDPIAGMIAEYVGLEPDVNAVDTYGHTALDYVQQATQPLTYQALQAHGATHHKAVSWYQRNKHAISTYSSKYASAMVEVSKDSIKSPVTWLMGGTLFFLGCLS